MERRDKENATPRAETRKPPTPELAHPRLGYRIAHRNGTNWRGVTANREAHSLHWPFYRMRRGEDLYKDIVLVGFATLAGFTASGIFANLYRLLADKPETTGGRIGYIAVMIVAGPNVLFANAATSFRAKSCSSFAFWLATAISAYWSFALGLFMIQIGLAV